MQPFDMFGAGRYETVTIPGVMVAVVTDNKDPEKQGRVKLQLPLHDEKTQTDWVRIATFSGGNGTGSYFIPEIGDEVLVAFHLGELREPYVIGMLWSGKQKPPDDAYSDKNDNRLIRSRSGHVIQFSDKEQDGKITITTAKGNIIEIADKADTIKIADKSGNNAVEIKGGSSNEVTVKSSQASVKLTTKGDVTINSPKSITLKSTQVTIEASAKLELKASGMVDVKSDGMLNIKGSMVKIN